mgnify:CR=1 FL=1|jgi:glycerol-3-phosphate dehydrogenase
MPDMSSDWQNCSQDFWHILNLVDWSHSTCILSSPSFAWRIAQSKLIVLAISNRHLEALNQLASQVFSVNYIGIMTSKHGFLMTRE